MNYESRDFEYDEDVESSDESDESDESYGVSAGAEDFESDESDESDEGSGESDEFYQASGESDEAAESDESDESDGESDEAFDEGVTMSASARLRADQDRNRRSSWARRMAADQRIEAQRAAAAQRSLSNELKAIRPGTVARVQPAAPIRGAFEVTAILPNGRKSRMRIVPQLAVGGDYSGPEGARRVIRERRAQAAVIETARGGILRRGLAISRARVAVVTNVSADHFGEYGIDDLAGLADVKLTVGGVVGAEGLLVLNADDAQLIAKAPALAQRFGRAPPLAWFALDADDPTLRAHRVGGGSTCGVREGRLLLHHAGRDADLGAVADLPLTVGGSAAYNTANLAGAALDAVTF